MAADEAQPAESSVQELLAELKLQQPRVWMTITNSHGTLVPKSLQKLCKQQGLPAALDDADALRTLLAAPPREAAAARSAVKRPWGGEQLRNEQWLMEQFQSLCSDRNETTPDGEMCFRFEDWLSWDWLKSRVGPAGSSAIITPEAARDLWLRIVPGQAPAEGAGGDIEVVAREKDFVALAIALRRECCLATSIQSVLRGRAGRQRAQQSQADQVFHRLAGVTKLAPFNPTPACAIDQALDALEVGPGDTLYDLGCGDGRLLLAAARRGAAALGVEYDERFAERARLSIAESELSHLASVVCDDACATDLAPATKLFVYLVPDGLRRMAPALAAALRSGTPIASYTFSLPGWTPSHVLSAETRATECKVWIYNSLTCLPNVQE